MKNDKGISSLRVYRTLEFSGGDQQQNNYDKDGNDDDYYFNDNKEDNNNKAGNDKTYEKATYLSFDSLQ